MKQNKKQVASSDESQDAEQEEQKGEAKGTKSKQGRKATDPRWTRVVKFKPESDEISKLYSYTQDSNKFYVDSDSEHNDVSQEESIFITFDQYEKDYLQLSFDKLKLSESKLAKLAQDASTLRQKFEMRAQDIDDDIKQSCNDSQNWYDLPPKKLRRKFTRQPRGLQKPKEKFLPEISLDQVHRKKRRMCDLDREEKLEIVHKALIQHISYANICAVHKVKPHQVGLLVKKTLKNQNFFEELKLVDMKKDNINQVIEDAAIDVLKEEHIIFNSQQVLHKAKERTDERISDKQVHLILKNRLGFSYRRLKRIEFHANAKNHIIARQQFGMKMIKLLKSGKRIINVDETWINQKDFRRRCWRKRGVSNSVGVPSVSPRITFMVAIDTDGQIFFCLTQLNTDTDSKRMMLHELCNSLDLDKPDWRDTSIILMDNASYNKTDETKEYIKKLRMPIIFTGKYSYDACPCELFFGYFKQALIFDQDTPTGKLIKMDESREVQPQDMVNINSLHFDYYIPGCYSCCSTCLLMNQAAAGKIEQMLDWYIEDLQRISDKYEAIEQICEIHKISAFFLSGQRDKVINCLKEAQTSLDKIISFRERAQKQKLKEYDEMMKGLDLMQVDQTNSIFFKN